MSYHSTLHQFNMNLRLFNTTYKELCAQKHNIFIGISVGVKPMSHDIALSYMEWAEKHSAGTIQILIADEIAKFNYLVFSHSTTPGALSRAIRDGDKYQLFFEKIITELPPARRTRFKVLRWKEIQTARFYTFLSKVVKDFESNITFRDTILSFVDKYTENRNKLLTQEKKLLLCQYLLHELPTLLDGITVDGINYNVILYPTYKHSGMSELVTEIQTGKKFISLANSLDLKKTIMVEFLIKSVPPTTFPIDIMNSL
ncbi:MAG: tRNA-dependent cyclodipeptide synthase [Gammaproteobacteria bacterium]